ncbi:MAG: ROK family protein [Reichenbachiella sp.]
MADYVLGIDIGGTNSKFGFVDREGNIAFEGSFPTEPDTDIHHFLNNLQHHISEFAGKNTVIGAGVGAPNANYYDGTIEHSPNIRWGKLVEFKKHFVEKFGWDMFLTNDANAAAMGELVFGGGQGMKHFVVFTLGTGLGSGFIVDGKLVYGHTGFAGEVGHVTVNPNGRYCQCGRKGCLETYVSATGIKKTVFKLMADYTQPSSLRDVSYNDLTAKMITEAAIKEDFIALKAFEYTGKMLGQVLADTVVHTSPEAIFLFGGLVHAGEYLLGPARKHMDENIFKPFQQTTKVLASSLMDKNAAVLGASSLAWAEFDTQK